MLCVSPINPEVEIAYEKIEIMNCILLDQFFITDASNRLQDVRRHLKSFLYFILATRQMAVYETEFHIVQC